MFDGLFSSKTAEKAVDGIIDAGDAIWFTDEEKQKAHQLGVETKIELLKAYEPFKLIQRHLALLFAYNFWAFVWLTLLVGFWGSEESFDMILDVAVTFSIGWIMIAIVVFYFGGGTINAMSVLNRKQK